MMIKIMNENRTLALCGVAISAMFVLFYLIDPALKFIGADRAVLPIYFNNYCSIIILSAAFAIYILGFRKIKNCADNFKVIIFFFILFNLILLFGEPLASTDLKCYISQGRIWSHYNDNPFSAAYAGYADDDFAPVLTNMNSKYPTPYGPLFQLISGAITYISGNDLFINIFLFKSFFVICNIIVFIILHLAFNDNKTSYLYGWSPILNFELILNAHNDIISIVLLATSIMFLIKIRGNLGLFLSWIFLVLSGFIKFIPFLFLPLFLIYSYRTMRSGKILFFAGALIFLCLISFLLYLPFGINIETFAYFVNFASDTNTAGNTMGFMILGGILSLFPGADIMTGVFFSKLSFFAAYLFILYKITAQKLAEPELIKYCVFAVAALLFLYVNIVLPWYFTNLLALLVFYYALAKNDKIVNYIFILTFFIIIQYFYIY